jgi:hypothetical protein
MKHYWCSVVDLTAPFGKGFVGAVILRSEPRDDLKKVLTQTCAGYLELPSKKLDVMILKMDGREGAEQEIKHWGVGKFFDPSKHDGYIQLSAMPDEAVKYVRNRAL